MPSPTGKVDRAQPGTDEGKNPLLLGEGGSAKPRRVWGGMNPDLVPPLRRFPFILVLWEHLKNRLILS